MTTSATDLRSDFTFRPEPERFGRYLRISWVLQGLPLFGVGALVVWLLLVLGLGRAIDRWVASTRYRIVDQSLRVESAFVWGVLQWRSKAAIPLERITDLRLVQGPLMSCLGIWRIDVQTAGRGMLASEARLFAVSDPERVREAILAQAREARGS